jgi:3'-phosphoadenosine 5'-phosphosulfate sulfotransferase (PAPS reductase)/FAD synthetase
MASIHFIRLCPLGRQTPSLHLGRGGNSNLERIMTITPEIESALLAGAAVAISVSGGKDSDAMTYAVLDWLKKRGFKNEVHLVHADLGRAELKATPAHVEELAKLTGLPLHVVRHSKFDLVAGIRNRMKVRPGAPPWPSAKNRQCTSDWKRGPISKWIRNQFPTGTVVCAMGLRADESPARAKKAISELRADCCSRVRRVYNWLPLHSETESGVWNTIGERPYHPAYDAGNDRVSCALCILANKGDLLNGATQDPDLFREYCDIEIESGFSFRQSLWLGHLAPQFLRADQEEFYRLKKAA